MSPQALPDSTEVAIVGAGPTGLVLAAYLASHRIPFVLIDRLAESANTSRAAVIHARTLEVLEELGLTERLLAASHVVPRFNLRDRDRALATIRFDGLPTAFPFTLMLPQVDTEKILVQRLRELGGEVFRPATLTGLQQDQDGATLIISLADGAVRELRARYVVGADGMHSAVREFAAIPFPGARYEQSFVLADVRMSWSDPADEVFLFFSPAGLVVVAPLPGGRHRIVATVDEAPEQPDLALVQSLLDARGPRKAPARIEEIVWSSRFRVHHRLAENYRKGPVLLAGDAAHVHSPAGGQGMNTGIQDAVTLGRALVDVFVGSAADARLDDYTRRRRPIAQRVVAFTDRMTRMATLKHPAARALRNLVLSLILKIAPIRHAIATELAELRYR